MTYVTKKHLQHLCGVDSGVSNRQWYRFSCDFIFKTQKKNKKQSYTDRPENIYIK